MPYDAWLRTHGRPPRATWRERWTDYGIHESLMLAKLPAVFLDWRRALVAGWPDEDARVYP